MKATPECFTFSYAPGRMMLVWALVFFVALFWSMFGTARPRSGRSRLLHALLARMPKPALHWVLTQCRFTDGRRFRPYRLGRMPKTRELWVSFQSPICSGYLFRAPVVRRPTGGATHSAPQMARRRLPNAFPPLRWLPNTSTWPWFMSM